MELLFGFDTAAGRIAKAKESIIAYLPSVEKVSVFVYRPGVQNTVIKPTTKIAVTRYTAYKKVGVHIIEAAEHLKKYRIATNQI